MRYDGFTYILTNDGNTVLYIGATRNLAKRLHEHRNHLLGEFSKKYHLNKLVYYESFERIEDALERERYLKGKTRKKKNAIIEGMNPTWADLSIQVGMR